MIARSRSLSSRFPSTLLASLALFTLSTQPTFGQTNQSAQSAAAGGRITGAVTVEGKPASGVVLLLYAPYNNNGPLSMTYTFGRSVGETKGRTISDADGNYAFNDLSAGNYIVFPFGPTLDTSTTHFTAAVDAHGRYEITGLPDGQYQISSRITGTRIETPPQPPQIITISGGQAPEVNLTLNLGGGPAKQFARPAGSAVGSPLLIH